MGGGVSDEVVDEVDGVEASSEYIWLGHVVMGELEDDECG